MITDLYTPAMTLFSTACTLQELHEQLAAVELRIVNNQKLKAQYELRKLEIEGEFQYAVAFDSTLKNDTQRSAVLIKEKLSSKEWIQLMKVDLPNVEAELTADHFKEKTLREIVSWLIKS
jgi:hypothetical protein